MQGNLTKIFKRFVIHHWLWYVAGMIVLFITNWVSLLIPGLAKNIVNAFTYQNISEQHVQIAMTIIALGLLVLIIRALSRLLIFWPARVLESEVKNHYFDRFLGVQQTFLDRFGMGDLISRIANDVTHIRVFFGFGALQIINFVFMLSLALIKMLSINQLLTLYALTPIISNIVFVRFLMPKMHSYSKQQQETLGTLTNKITEAFVNVHIIQSNNASKSFSRVISGANQNVYKTNVKLAVFRNLVFPLLGLMSSFSYLIVLFYGGKLAMDKTITIGDLLAFNAYLALLSFPLMAIGIILAVLQRARTAAERLAEIDKADLEHPTCAPVQPIYGEQNLKLVVNNLNYDFINEDGSTNRVLSNISFEIMPGEKVGFIGPVGCGKSVLFSLITRIYDPPRGSVLINDVDILDISPQELRKMIGFVTQSVHLFSDSVRNNLTLGIPGKSDKQIAKASFDASVLKDIESFENSWDSEIGEKGLRLSGGQKQRLSLARILLREPQAYILDDVLSAVDHSTEKRIIEALLSKNNTMLIASHRSSVVRHCNKVIAINEGKIIDIGNFNEISSRHPDYFELEDRS